ncbi:prolipoprotein diacylglyceryl transferase [Thermosediminibacter oceani]|uniref:Phosphatidylglycerol--prolipoprotein diacylglyceryl transferase n=1 Tax=Thermosediminibacter oceani (strain ATCC BAA-1034 / DSM 16646 / JW/IW-1228P) TaxID=555079 RepID=D9S258_THEOJ|nr:prolipoprotein diacylglyceryl transferase [Thermosediminibacter oceani]ADL07485.1 prolipoprotein diacylglyceryl transferase [Thermosediminibacter oceani DSM 16646]
MGVLFRIGPFNIYKLGFFTALGLLAGLYIAMREARRKGIKEDEIINFVQVIVIAGFVGARLLFVLLDLPYYIKNPSMIWHISEGGLSFHGAVLGGLLAGIIYARYKKVSFFKLSDVVSPGLALGYSIGRIGCDIYGKAAKVPWAVTVDGIPRHPVQFYSALSALIIFYILWKRRKMIRYDGELFLNFMLLYSVYRFFIEFFRESIMIGPLSIAQWVSLILILGSSLVSHFISAGKLTKNAS